MAEEVRDGIEAPELEMPMVTSHHAGVGNQTQAICKSIAYFLTAKLSLQPFIGLPVSHSEAFFIALTVFVFSETGSPYKDDLELVIPLSPPPNY